MVYPKKKDELKKPITLEVLLEYTDSFLIPKIDEIITDRLKTEISASEHRLKDYIDRKLSDHTAELFKRLDERYRKDKQFKQKVVELFRKNKIGAATDIAFLEGLAQ